MATKRTPQETESLLIAVQNNAIRTNYIKAKIDDTQQNIKYMLYGEKYGTVNQIISEYNKKYKGSKRLGMTGGKR